MTYLKKGTSGILIQSYRYDVVFNLLSKVILFINNIITVRVLGLKPFGELAFFYAVPLLMSIFITQGNGAGLSRYLPQLKDSDPACMQRLVNRSVVHNLIFSIIGISIFIFLGDGFLGMFSLKGVALSIILLLSVNSLFTVLEEPIQTFLRVNYDNLFLNWAALTQNAFSIAAFYCLWFWGRLSVQNLILVSAAAAILKFLLSCYRYSTLHSLDYAMAVPRQIAAGFRAYSLKMFVYSLLNYFTSQRGVIYFIQLYLGAASVGVFRIVQALVDNVKDMLIPRTLNVSTTASMIERFASEGNRGLNAFMRKYLILNCLSAFAILTFLASNMKWILAVYAVDYGSHHLFVALYLVFSFWVSLLGVYHKHIVAYERNEFFIVSKIISFVIMMSVFAAFMKYGLWVAPAALASITVVEIALYHLIIRRHNADYLPARAIAKQFIFYAIGFVVIDGLSVAGVGMIYVYLCLIVVVSVPLLSDVLIEPDVRALIRTIVLEFFGDTWARIRTTGAKAK